MTQPPRDEKISDEELACIAETTYSGYEHHRAMARELISRRAADRPVDEGLVEECAKEIAKAGGLPWDISLLDDLKAEATAVLDHLSRTGRLGNGLRALPEEMPEWFKYPIKSISIRHWEHLYKDYGTVVPTEAERELIEAVIEWWETKSMALSPATKVDRAVSAVLAERNASKEDGE